MLEIFEMTLLSYLLSVKWRKYQYTTLHLVLFLKAYTYTLYVAMQHFKISTSDLKCASKCAISIVKNQKFSRTPQRLRRLDAAPSKLKSCLRHWLSHLVDGRQLNNGLNR